MFKYITVLIVLFGSTAYCQQKAQPIPNELKNEVITIEAKKIIASENNFPFSTVQILDYRFDTSKIGFSRNKKSLDKNKILFQKLNYAYRKTVVKNGLRNAMEEFYNASYKDNLSSDSSSLLIVIKRFWADPFPNLQKIGNQATDISRESNFNLYVQFEFLLKKDSLYLPIKRVDTIFQMSPVGVNIEYQLYTEKGYNIYEYALIKVFESVNYQFYADKYAIAKTKKTFREVIAFNEKRFSYPILKDSALREGVYMSFTEFKNNQPSITQYKVQSNKKLGAALYHNSSKDSSMIFKYLGYCDGKNIYFGDLEHPLFRTGNTFDFFTNRVDFYNVSIPVMPSSTGFLSADVSDKEKSLEPFQIDMETGKIY